MSDGPAMDRRRARIRLVALDLDGTLLGSDGRVPGPNREALSRAAQAGVTVALASGRMTDCIAPTAESLGIDCPVIAYNGGMVRGSGAEAREVVFHVPLPAEYGRELIDYCRGRYLLNFYLDDALYAEGLPALAPWRKIYSDQTGAVYHLVDDLGVLRERAPTKAIIIASHDERERLHDEWAARWGDRTTIIKTNPEYLEFLNRDTDKGVALDALACHLGLAREEVMAMGDGDNDAPMLRAAGLGVAVANASPLTKESADLVMDLTHDECAVAKAVERYVLSND